MIDHSWPQWKPSRGLQPREWPFACIGPGRVGCALSRALAELGFPAVAVGGGTGGSAELLAQELGAEVIKAPFTGLGNRARLVVLTPPDRELEHTVHSLQEGAGLGRGSCLIQTSAALPASILDYADRDVSSFLLSFHPLKPFPDRDRDLRQFMDILIGIEGDDQSFHLGESLALLLGANPIRLSSDDKSMYHAAGVLALTGVMALAWSADQIGESMDLKREFMTKGILPGMRSAIDAIETHGLPGALTGPVSRSDIHIITGHLEVLSQEIPELVPLYRQVVLITLRIAEQNGLLDDETAEKLHSLLDI
ncbi:Rossmann-like and DUF2520 domain-containing protein [Candidatus Zixiibacteriota bacterium]